MSHENIAVSESDLNNWPGVVKFGLPGGFCAGVERSVDAYRNFVDAHSKNPVYSVGEPAHNPHVNQEFLDKGVRFVENIDQVPPDAPVIFGPHGHTKEDEQKASLMVLNNPDLLEVQSISRDIMFTECPLVTKVKDEIKINTMQGYTTIYFGQLDKDGKPHPETRAALSSGKAILVTSLEQALSDETSVLITDLEKVAFATQTTHNADEALEMAEKLKEKYPIIKMPKAKDICYATRNRQMVAKSLDSEVIVVVGDLKTSSNTRSLVSAAELRGLRVYAVNDSSELEQENFMGINSVGVEASASAPREKIDEVLEFFTSRGSVLEEFRVKDINGKIIDEGRIHFEAPKIKSAFRPQVIWSDPNRF